MAKILKIIAIIIGVILLGIAVVFAVAFGIFNKTDNNLSQSRVSYEMPMADSLSGGSIKNLSSGAAGLAEESLVTDADDFTGQADKKVIKTGNLTLKVDRISEAQEEIASIAEANGGGIFSSNIYQSAKNVKSGNITIKVPVDNFEKVFAELKKTASLVVRESTSGQDVTEQYQDLETRIKNKQAEEQSYVRILNQAQKIEDILAITRQVSTVRGEIERLQGQLKYLDSQTDMSTITISLSEDQNITATDSWRPWQITKEAVSALIKSLQSFVTFLIILIVTFIPTFILYLFIVWIIYLIVRKVYRKVRKKRSK